jgi:hypothetical protein
MYSSNGIRSFFPDNGVAVQMFRDIPYAIATLLTYEMLQERWVRRGCKEDEKPPRWRNMVAGAIAGGVGSLVTNPMDVIKTRIQTDPLLYSGIRQCFASTLKNEGAMAFAKGAAPRLMHKIPANGFFFMFYEMFRLLLNVETRQ